MFDFHFRLGEREDADKLYKFFSQKGLDYKGFNPWLLKATEEYRYEIKRAMLGFYEDYLVSALIFQNCKHMVGFTELKSGRTIEEYLERYFMSFSIRQVEKLAQEEGMIGMIYDVRIDRPAVLDMLKKDKYKVVAIEDLYDEGHKDAVLMKPLVETSLFWNQVKRN